MALEQILAELDDLEERVENLNVDQKTNEDILLNVLKRVDETEKDLRKVLSPCHVAWTAERCSPVELECYSFAGSRFAVVYHASAHRQFLFVLQR